MSTETKLPALTSITVTHTVRTFVLALDAQTPQKAPTVYGRLATINRLEEFLCRPARVKDLTESTLIMFFEFLRERPNLKQNTIVMAERFALRIARQAAELDLVPFPLVSEKHRTVAEDDISNPGRAALLRYFEERFTVDKRLRGKPLSRETMKAYRAGIRSFSRFAPRIRSVKHISRKKLIQFRQWLLARGMNAKKAGNHTFAVAAIVRHCCPERFLEIDDTPRATNGPRTLAYVFEKQFLPCRQSITSIRSEKKYTAVFNSFGRHLGRIATLDDLTDENVGRYMRELRRTGRAVRTVNGYRAKLMCLWTWAAKRGLVEHFPTVEKMPEPAMLPVAWTVDELRQLLAGIAQMPGEVAGVPAPDWWRALHYVAWDCGERTGALLAMTWQMLDPKTGQLAIPAEFRKGGKKPMLYTLKPQTMEMLQRMRLPARELIFDWGPDRVKFYAHYRRLLKLAGLPYVRYKSALQKMRRSFATHLENAGGNATEAFNHGERSTTVGSYLDPRLIERTPPNELLFELEPAMAGN